MRGAASQICGWSARAKSGGTNSRIILHVKEREMFLSMHNWMRAEPIEVTIRRLAKYGYQTIEIAGEPDKYDTREVGRLLKENGVRCWGSVSLMFAGRDLIHADAAVRESTVQYLKDCITMVHELRGREMT